MLTLLTVLPLADRRSLSSARHTWRRPCRCATGLLLALALALTMAAAPASAQKNPPFAQVVAGARNGDPGAQYMAGMMLLSGQGTRQDIPTAVRWLRASADAGVPQAMVALAGLHDVGLGVPFDAARATQWRETAAKAGNAFARSQLELDTRLPGNRDHRRAALLTDLRYYDAAVPFAQRSAAAGSLEGLELLGRAHHLGLGLPVNKPAALKLYEQAAAGGLTQAMRSAAFMYEFGEGTSVDRNKALAYYDRAAEMGSQVARQAAAHLRSPGYRQRQSGGSGGTSDPYQTAMNNRCEGAGGRWQGGQCVVNGNGGTVSP